MALFDLIEKRADHDFIREMLAFAAMRLMGCEADAPIGAPLGAKSSERLAQRNGYRERALDTRTGAIDLKIPRLRRPKTIDSVRDNTYSARDRRSLAMDVLRTPDACFDGLSGYSFAPRYADVRAGDGAVLRMHYLDEGPRDGEILLCLHGQPSWSYLYRKMIPRLTAAGYRVLAPDLIGFGRSDKPTRIDDYTYAGHVDWLGQWITGLDVRKATLVCQDWGGLIGLRAVADHPDRFARLVIANTGLPDSRALPEGVSAMLGQLYQDVPVPDAAMVVEQFSTGGPGAFLYWVKYASESPTFSVRDVFAILSRIDDPAVLDGYAAPFPDARYLAGARKFPALVPLLPHHKAERQANDRAWKVLEAFERPVLTAFTDDDPVTRGGEVPFQTRIPGARGRTHVTIKNGGHFLQEQQPAAFSDAIIQFMRETA